MPGRLSRYQRTLLTLLSFSLFSSEHFIRAELTDGQKFDFVIVGGGTAGCVLANRLSEVSTWSVLLVEAGGKPPKTAKSPGLSLLFSSLFPDWNYYTLNDNKTAQAHKTKSINEIKAKVLGGCSIINYMYYVRGNKVNYDQWEELGNPGWGWSTVLEYFKKSERMTDPEILNSASGSLHGTTGYMGVTRSLWGKRTKHLFEAFKENGHDILEDTNGHQQLGFSPSCFTIANGIRQSTEVSFLQTANRRRNLYVAKNTFTRKIIFDNNNNAIGIEITTESEQNIKIWANKEVILSAGSISSPQILMLSGVGPKEQLEQYNIKTMFNSPKVGRNLQNHMLVPVVITGKKDRVSILNTVLDPITNLDKIPIPNIIGFVALDKNQTYPDYEVTAMPLSRGSMMGNLYCSAIFKYEDYICSPIKKVALEGQSLLALITFLHPTSTGQVSLRSANPKDLPIIETNFFGDPSDLDHYAKYLQDYTSIVNTTYFKGVKSEIVNLNVKGCEGFIFGSNDYWKCYALNMVTSHFHSAGTCAMDPDGVVDERLKVKGVNRLRVVDASVMPRVVSGNTNAPVIMIAEKASDMIKTDNGIE